MHTFPLFALGKGSFYQKSMLFLNFHYFCVDERLPEHSARGGRRGGADAGRGRMRPWRQDRAGRAAHDVEVI